MAQVEMVIAINEKLQFDAVQFASKALSLVP